MRHVWRIGQPLHRRCIMYCTGGQKAHVEKCHSMCKNVSPHARSMNETEIGGCCGSFPVRCTAHGTDGDHKVVRVYIVTTRLRIITVQTARSSEATEERRYIRCARPCACVQSCSRCTVAWHRRQRAPPLYLESLRH